MKSSKVNSFDVLHTFNWQQHECSPWKPGYSGELNI